MHPELRFPHPVRDTLAVMLFGVCIFPSSLALAAFDQMDVTPPGGFITSMSGTGVGANLSPGFDTAAGFFGAPSQDESLFAPPDMPNVSTVFTNGFTEASSLGTARLGRVTFGATSEQTYTNTLPGSHATGVINGGWTDTISIDSPGQTGTDAIWLFQVDIFAALEGSGFTSSPGVLVRPFINGAQVSNTLAGFNDGGSDAISSSFQSSQFFLQLPFIGANTTRTVNTTATFAVPITLGTPFELGLYAMGVASATTNSAFSSIISDADINGNVTWAGDAGLSTVGGTPISTYTLDALSGTAWLLPVPLPAGIWLLLSGVIAIGGSGRMNRFRLTVN